MGMILERLGMTTSKNQKSAMGKVRGWEKPKDGDENRDGIRMPVTALIMTVTLTLVENYLEGI